MKTFYAVLVNSLVASVTNNLVWFAVTFWVYLETQSVVATAVMAGVYTATTALSGFFLGSLVDRYPKRAVMLVSSFASLGLYAVAAVIYASTPPAEFTRDTSPVLWAFVVLALFGALAGNLRAIALSTLVTLLVPEPQRDKANGQVGTANGVGFLLASVFSGLIIGFLGVMPMLLIALALTVVALLHLFTITLPGLPVADPASSAANTPPANQGVDLRGTIAAVNLVPGLFALIFFHTFNNFLGGVYMSLLDAYGLQLVSVQVWGTLFGFLSLGFIVGGLVVARKGLGKSPLRTQFLGNVVMWTICIFFAIQPSIVLLTIGMFIWLTLIPIVEAAEQTILQNIVPPERQGRVFGFAQSVEQAASPITAFFIGPIAQNFFIPFMTTGAGAQLLGPWFGVGINRGLALVFIIAGVIGLVVTLLAMRSRAYRLLSHSYAEHVAATAAAAASAPANAQPAA